MNGGLNTIATVTVSNFEQLRIAGEIVFRALYSSLHLTPRNE
jgi:hypothetical protein